MGFPFSSRTVGSLVRAISQGYTHGEIGTLLLDAEADRWAPSEWPNKEVRLQDLFKRMRQINDTEVEKSALELARLVMKAGAPRNEWSSPAAWWEPLRVALAADGWEYEEKNRRLVPTIPGVQFAEEATEIETALRKRRWMIAAGHYRQAVDGFADGRWASSNGQLRSLLEDLLPLAAESVSGSRPKEVQAALDILRKKGILASGEYGFAKGLWDLSQSSGPHPGLSDEEEARFRLTTVTGYARFLLTRLA